MNIAHNQQGSLQSVGFLPRFMTHAIGDKAVDDVLSLYEQLEEDKTDLTSAWLRIEHVQHIAGPETARRMAALGAYAVINPLHLLADAPMLERRLGAARAGPDRAYAWRTLADAGVKLACGSDWPVVDLDPLQSIHAAIYRTAGRAGALPEGSERPRQGTAGALTGSEALVCHTRVAAEAMGAEEWLGSLAPGKLADLTILSFDPRDADRAGELPTVLAVFVGGKRVAVGSEAGAADSEEGLYAQLFGQQDGKDRRKELPDMPLDPREMD